jgi:F420-0:gamma-glutamyl ligase
MVVTCAAPARNSVTCRHGATRAFAGVARLASGELSAGAPVIVIRKPPSTSPQIMNIADQASRLT